MLARLGGDYLVYRGGKATVSRSCSAPKSSRVAASLRDRGVLERAARGVAHSDGFEGALGLLAAIVDLRLAAWSSLFYVLFRPLDPRARRACNRAGRARLRLRRCSRVGARGHGRGRRRHRDPQVEFDRIIKRARASCEAQGQEFPKTGSPEYIALRDSIVRSLVERAEFALEAEELDIEVTDEEIEKRLDELK